MEPETVSLKIAAHGLQIRANWVKESLPTSSWSSFCITVFTHVQYFSN